LHKAEINKKIKKWVPGVPSGPYYPDFLPAEESTLKFLEWREMPKNRAHQLIKEDIEEFEEYEDELPDDDVQ
jgi:hypothetical protein